MAGKNSYSMKERFDYIDVAKSLGMLCVIWGHIMMSGLSHNFVYAFHIPLFFFISGMMYNNKKYDSFVVFCRKRFVTLLIPYFVYSVITWIIWALYSYLSHDTVDSYIMPLLQTFIAQGSGAHFLIHNGPLWFVTCLFVVEMAYYFIGRLPRVINLLICGLLAILSVWMIRNRDLFDFTLLPWSMEVAAAAIIFYSMGNLYKDKVTHEAFLQKVNNILGSAVLLFVLLAIVVWGANYNGAVSMGSNNFGRSPLLFYCLAICGIFLVLILSALIVRFFDKTKGYKLVRWFGRNSFDAMAIHNPLKGIIIVVVGIVLGTKKDVIIHSYGYASIVFVLTTIATMFVMRGVEIGKAYSHKKV